MRRPPLLILFAALAAPLAGAADFADVAAAGFARWDRDHDGVLTVAELDAAVADPANVGKDAAVLAALKRATRNPRYQVPKLTPAYLREAAAAPAEPDQPDFKRMYKEGLAAIASASSREPFAGGPPKLATIHQGNLGNCFCLAPLGAMTYRDPQQVVALFAREPDGAYRVTLGRRSVRIAPPTEAELALTSKSAGGGLWVNLYEKAVGTALNDAKPAGQRAGSPLDVLAKGGSAGTILEFITGHPVRRISFVFGKDGKADEESRQSQLRELRTQLVAAGHDRRLVTCGTTAVTTPGLTPNHAYAVLGYDADKQLVRLWNPHGGAFVPKGEPGPKNGYAMKDGIFEIGLVEWTRQFSGMAYEAAVK